MSAEIIALIATVGAAVIVFAWKKWGQGPTSKGTRRSTRHY